jgi:hypothetical protein
MEMARIYREVEDLQSPTPRPSGNASVKIPSAEPFDSQRRVEALEGKYDQMDKKLGEMGSDLKGIKEALMKKESNDMDADDEMEGVETEDKLEGEESTDPMDKDGMKIGNVDKTTSAAPPVKSMQKYSQRKSIVGSETRSEKVDVRKSVKEFLKGYGGMM